MLIEVSHPIAAGMKTFFPDLPLNSGFYRCFEIIAPEGSIVDAKWPIAVTGFLMPFEKIMNSIYEMWSKLMPERALACAFNLEYLLTGGLDARSPDKPIFMFYDWLPGGWGGRNGKDGSNDRATAVHLQFANVFSGLAVRGREPERQALVEDIAACGVAHARKCRPAWGRKPAD